MMAIMKYVLCFWPFLYFIKGNEFQCPEICICNAYDVSTKCQNNQLTELPRGLFSEILSLDLSLNKFSIVPTNISSYKSLEFLNMSYNRLSYLKSNSLEGLNALKVLDLSYNVFEDWRDIHNDAFMTVPSLLKLDFSYNNLRGFPDIMVEYPLKSESLQTLYLTNCSITNLLGDILLGLTNIQKLILTRNPILTFNTQIISKTLHTLDLSECNLHRIHPDAFVESISLKTVSLSKNFQLKKFHSRSNSLTSLDLSHCNLESISPNHLPNLTKLNFKGNHFRHILANNFESFPSLHSLDLSNNAIEKIDVLAFHGLKFVESIDLSFNTISKLLPETFITNTKLYYLNLSRNYLSEVGQLVIESLKWLDMSFCEIRKISRDSLIMMPALQKLNLSRNFISHIPNRLQADELCVLDLSMCGIFSLNNLTFISLTRLRTLNLSGNKITTGMKPVFFHGVTELMLADNSWLCDCHSDDFRQFYNWYFYEISTTSTLRCRSPENFAGLTWEGACQTVWFEKQKPSSDSMWIYSVSLVVLMSFLCCVVIFIRHVYHHKATRAREDQEQEHEDACERLHQIHMRNVQYRRESQSSNAPDPRELQTPPSYAEAVSMPRLNVSCSSITGSLHSLHSSNLDITRRTKPRRKRRRSRQSKANITETQSTASLSHARTEDSSEEEFRQTQSSNNFVESSF